MNLRRFHSLFLLLALPVGAIAGAPANAASQSAADAAMIRQVVAWQRAHPVVPGACDAPAAIIEMHHGIRWFLHKLAVKGDLPYTPRIQRYSLLQNASAHRSREGGLVLRCPFVLYIGNHHALVVDVVFRGPRSGVLTSMPSTIYLMAGPSGIHAEGWVLNLDHDQ